MHRFILGRGLAAAGMALAVSLLFLPAFAQQDVKITIARIGGTVEVMHTANTKGQWVKAKKDQQIGAGWSLRTAADSKAQLVFPQDNVVILKASSLLTVDNLTAGGGAKLNAKSGGLLVDIKRALSAGSEFEVQTPSALAVVRGTKFAVEIDPNPSPHIAGGDTDSVAGGGMPVEMNFMLAGKPMQAFQVNTSFAVLLGGSKTDVDGDGQDDLVVSGEPVKKWIEASLSMNYMRKSGELKAADFKRIKDQGGMIAPIVEMRDSNDGGDFITISWDDPAPAESQQKPTATSDRRTISANQVHHNEVKLRSVPDIDGDGVDDYIVEDGEGALSLLEQLADSMLGADEDGEVADRGEASEVWTGKNGVGQSGDAYEQQADRALAGLDTGSPGGGVAKTEMWEKEQGRKSPRDVATGQSSGKRQHGLQADDLDGDGVPDVIVYSHEVKSPRDSASGQASGKRNQEQDTQDIAKKTDMAEAGMRVAVGDVNGDGIQDEATLIDDVDGDGMLDLLISGDLDGDGRLDDLAQRRSPEWKEANNWESIRNAGMTAGKEFSPAEDQLKGNPRHRTAPGGGEEEQGGEDGPQAAVTNPKRAVGAGKYALDLDRRTPGGNVIIPGGLVAEMRGAAGGGGGGAGGESTDVKSPRDVATGQSSGKQVFGMFMQDSGNRVNISFDPRASGDMGGRKTEDDNIDFTLTVLTADIDQDGLPDYELEGGPDRAEQLRAALTDFLGRPHSGANAKEAQANPLYKGSTKGGDNPLYQGNQRMGDGSVNEMYSDLLDREAGEEMYMGAELEALLELDASLVSPRDAASGLPTGKRQHKPIRMATGDVNGDGMSDKTLEIEYLDEDSDDDGVDDSEESVKSPRDSASGQASGKRQAGGAKYSHVILKNVGDADGDGLDDYATSSAAILRDHATGLASGKRQHGAVTAIVEDNKHPEGDYRTVGGEDASGNPLASAEVFAPAGAAADGGGGGEANDVKAPRDVATGQSSGKRQFDPLTVTGDGGFLSGKDWLALEHEIKAPRDVATGQASGKRQHLPIRIRMADADGDGIDDLEIEVEEAGIVSPRDAASGLPTGKRQHKPIRFYGIGDMDGDGLADYLGDASDIAALHEIKAPRDVATGQSSGKRQFDPSTVQSDGGFLSGAEIQALALVEHEIVSPRDAASGLPTGKRMHKPFSFKTTEAGPDGVTGLDVYIDTLEIQEGGVNSGSVKSPRDSASGQATGKRTHGPLRFQGVGDVDGDGLADYLGDPGDVALLHEIKSPRDVATGQSSGKRQYDPRTVAGEGGFLSGAEWDALQHEVVSPRDAASGLPTGKRQHKPFTFTTGDLDGDGRADLTLMLEIGDDKGEAGGEMLKRDSASGQATGKRQHKAVFYGIGDVDGDGRPDFFGDSSDQEMLYDVKAPRDVATGQSSGKRQHNPLTVQDDGGFLSGAEWAALEHEIKAPRDVATGQASGKRQHSPIRVATGDVDGDGLGDLVIEEQEEGFGNDLDSVKSPRDSASGQATGKRQHKPMTFYGIGDVDEDGLPDYLGDASDKAALKIWSDASGHFDLWDGQEAAAPRDVATGQSSGKRQFDPRSVGSDGGFLSGAAWQALEHEIVSPRDAASGLPTGKRQHLPIRIRMADADGDGIEDLDIEIAEADIVSPRDAASGLPTGKRQHKPIRFYGIGNVDGDGLADFLGDASDLAMLHEIKSPRDVATGQSSGKRQFDPSSVGSDGGFLSGAEWTALEHAITSPRDAASGLPTGKRQHKPIEIMRVDNDGDGLSDLSIVVDRDADAGLDGSEASVKSPRDAASGLPTGKRQHKPIMLYGIGDIDSDGVADFLGDEADLKLLRDIATGQASGKRRHEVTSPRDPATGQASGKRQYDPATVGGDGGFMGGKEWFEVLVTHSVDLNAAPPRDAASGLPTGKRQHLPIRFRMADADGDGVADLDIELEETDIVSPRDAASGLPTGKRQHKPIMLYGIGNVDGDGLEDFLGDEADLKLLRDVATGQASGKRGQEEGDPLKEESHFVEVTGLDSPGSGGGAGGLTIDEAGTGGGRKKPNGIALPNLDGDGAGEVGVAAGDLDGDGRDDYSVWFSRGPRQTVDMSSSFDTGSNQRSIKQGHYAVSNFNIEVDGIMVPAVQAGDVNGDGRPDLIVGSAAAGDGSVRSPRDVATGQASGKRQYNPKELSIGKVVEVRADLDGDGAMETLDAEAVDDMDGDGLAELIVLSGSGMGAMDAASKDAAKMTLKMADQDADGVSDHLDANSDGDGMAEIIVGDLDGDGSPERATPWTADLDGDGLEDMAILSKWNHEMAKGIIGNIKARTAPPGGRALAGLDTDSPGGGAAKLPRSVLKEYFQSGDKPTQAQFVVTATDPAGNTGDDATYKGSLSIGDVDGDGLEDLVVSLGKLGAADRGTGQGASGQVDQQALATLIEGVLVRGIPDFDSDGLTDFEFGDEPDAAAFASLLDSMVNFVDDRDFIGLKEYDPTKDYLPGDVTVFNDQVVRLVITAIDKFNNEGPAERTGFKASHITFGGGNHRITIEATGDKNAGPQEFELTQNGDVDGDGANDWLLPAVQAPEFQAFIDSIKSGRAMTVNEAKPQAPRERTGAGGGPHVKFHGYEGTVEITNEQGTSMMPPGTSVDVSGGGAPGNAAPSGDDAQDFLDELEDPGVFEEFETAAEGITGDLGPIRAELQKTDRELKVIEDEWKRHVRTQDIGKLLLLFKLLENHQSNLKQIEAKLASAITAGDTSPSSAAVMDNLRGTSGGKGAMTQMIDLMGERGVPDTDLPPLLYDLFERIDGLLIDIEPYIQGEQDKLDDLQGIIEPDPRGSIRHDLIDTDNDGVGDALEAELGTDPVRDDRGGFFELIAPDDGDTFAYPPDGDIFFEFEPLDTDADLDYMLILESGGQQSVRRNAREREKFTLSQLAGPQGLFANAIKPNGELDIDWHVEAQLRRPQRGGPAPRISSETRRFTIQTPANTVVEVNISSAAAKLGVPVTLVADITDVNSLQEWEIEVAYDPLALAFVQGNKRGLFTPATVFFNDNGSGIIVVSGRSPGTAGITGAGDIFELTFNPLVAGDTEVEPTRVTLRDTLGNTIDGRPGDTGEVRVTRSAGPSAPPAPPAPMPGSPAAPSGTFTPGSGPVSGNIGGMDVGPLWLVSPSDGDVLDYPQDTEVEFEFDELQTRLDVVYNLVVSGGGAQKMWRDYVAGDPIPLKEFFGRNNQFSKALGGDGSLQLQWRIEAEVDSGSGAPQVVKSDARQLTIQTFMNKSVTVDLYAVGGAPGGGHKPGSPVRIKGDISQVEGLAEWQITVRYDEGVLRFDRGRGTGILSNSRVDKAGMGKIVISGSSSTGISGDGPCFELEFIAANSGTTQVEPDDVELMDILGRVIDGSGGQSVDVDVL